jgi:hypothetical protein
MNSVKKKAWGHKFGDRVRFRDLVSDKAWGQVVDQVLVHVSTQTRIQVRDQTRMEVYHEDS